MEDKIFYDYKNHEFTFEDSIDYALVLANAAYSAYTFCEIWLCGTKIEDKHELIHSNFKYQTFMYDEPEELDKKREDFFGWQTDIKRIRMEYLNVPEWYYHDIYDQLKTNSRVKHVL